MDKIETNCGMIPTGYDLSGIQRRPRNIGEEWSEKLHASDKPIETVDGEKCHFPFTFKRHGTETTYNTCINEGHNTRYWCCLEAEL